jgi:hypothetical protein
MEPLERSRPTKAIYNSRTVASSRPSQRLKYLHPSPRDGATTLADPLRDLPTRLTPFDILVQVR